MQARRSPTHSLSSTPTHGRINALWPLLLLLCLIAIVACRMVATIYTTADTNVFRGQVSRQAAATAVLPTPHETNRTHRQNDILDLEAAASSDKPGRQSRPSYSYVLYITSDTYACASMVLLDQLRNKLHSSPDINITVLHTDAVSPSYLAKWRTSSNFGEGVHPVQVAPIRASSGDATWLHSLTKLRIFQHIGYDRVVFLDADSLPIRNLDHLFDLPTHEEGDGADVQPLFYAPKAYWLPQPFFASTVMVLTPSNATFDSLMAFVAERRRSGAANHGGDFDMDVLNAYFGASLVSSKDEGRKWWSLVQETTQQSEPKPQRPRAKLLSGKYVILNSDFRKPPNEKLSVLEGITVDELRQQVQVVHYSCLPSGRYGKPWGVVSEEDRNEVITRVDMTTQFHPFFLELFVTFWNGSKAWCSAA